MALNCHLQINSNHCAIKCNQMTYDEIKSKFHYHSSRSELLFDGIEHLEGPDLSCKIISLQDMVKCLVELLLFDPPMVINWRYWLALEKKTSLPCLHHIFCQLAKEYYGDTSDSRALLVAYQSQKQESTQSLWGGGWPATPSQYWTLCHSVGRKPKHSLEKCVFQDYLLPILHNYMLNLFVQRLF